MSDDLLQDAKTEISGMAKDGMGHPSTKPVLIGGALGAVAGAALPLLSVPTGLVIGLGIAFYKRLRP